jgi:hypothetical protein
MTFEQVSLLHDLKRAPRTARETLELLKRLMDEIWIMEIVPVRLNPGSDDFTLIIKAQFKPGRVGQIETDVEQDFES